MTQQEALEEFENWYSKCIEDGIEPEKIVALCGNMALVTNDEALEYLEKGGFL